jgi:hypothetical protein
MIRIQNRREFMEATACTGGCLLLGPLASRAGADSGGAQKKTYDFSKLTYCCYECKPDQCPLLKASLANDLEYKKKEAAKWRERYRREFTLDEVFCLGCKVEPAKQAYNIKACDVRSCVIEKGLVSCAHCRELAD